MIAWTDEIQTFSRSELDNLLGPIAIYSDPLIAQILPAATFLDQLQEADDFTRNNNNVNLIDDQDWDVSVKAVAHYPSVLTMMVDDPDWTIAIGQAFVNQPDDVMNSIQRLRSRARLMSNLNSNQYQRIYDEDGYIRIVPVDPEYIYVPQYNPEAIYTRSSSVSGADTVIAFGIGLLIGSWLDRDVDWSHHNVYYHGWKGEGWIAQSRPRVDTGNSHYVNSSYTDRPVYINRSVTNVNIGNYRTEVRQNRSTYRLPRPQSNLHNFGTIPAPQVIPHRTGLQPGTNRQFSGPGVRTPINPTPGNTYNRNGNQRGQQNNPPRNPSTNNPYTYKPAPAITPRVPRNTQPGSSNVPGNTRTVTPRVPRNTPSVSPRAPGTAPAVTPRAPRNNPSVNTNVPRNEPAVTPRVPRNNPSNNTNAPGYSSPGRSGRNSSETKPVAKQQPPTNTPARNGKSQRDTDKQNNRN